MTGMTTERKHQVYLLEILKGWKRPTMVELGVASGETSEYLLRRHPGLYLYMVDNWKCPPHRLHRRSWGQGTYDRGRENAERRTRFARSRRRIICGDSAESASQVGLVDVVFVDADHKFASVYGDIQAWWGKVNVGGVMCGHDIDSPKDLNGTWGVRRAVEEYFRHPPQVEGNIWMVVNDEKFGDHSSENGQPAFPWKALAQDQW